MAFIKDCILKNKHIDRVLVRIAKSYVTSNNSVKNKITVNVYNHLFLLSYFSEIKNQEQEEAQAEREGGCVRTFVSRHN